MRVRRAVVLLAAVASLAIPGGTVLAGHTAPTPHAAPPITLNEIQAYQNVVAPGDMLVLFRYELPLEVGGADAWCAELIDIDGCSSTPPAPTAPTGLASGLAELRFYTDVALTDLMPPANVPRIDHALGGLYFGAGHGLTFGSTTARACVSSSTTIYSVASSACSPLLWRGAADLAATEALLTTDLVQLVLNLQGARDLALGELVSGTGLITTSGTLAGQTFALEAFPVADRILPDAFATSGDTILPVYATPSAQPALQTALDAQASGSTVEVALANVGREFFGTSGPTFAIIIVLGVAVALAGSVSYATRGNQTMTILAGFVPIVLGMWFRSPVAAVLFTLLSVMALLTVLWFVKRVPSG